MFDIVIVGAGIVGLATSLRLIEKNPSLRIIILEKEHTVAQHQTGHNSGVIHSGIYYKPGSLKASNCIAGYRQMVEFCRKHGIEHELCGKIIVATDVTELPRLNALYERGVANGLHGLRKLSKEQITEIEPYVNGLEGIHVPQTGIVDYGDVAKKMAEVVQGYNVTLRFDEKVRSIQYRNSYSTVETETERYEGKVVVSCSGLHSDRVARFTDPSLDIRIIPFRGEYYTLKKEKEYLVRNLVYPVPDPAFPFLGVHFTRMICGGIEAGPNAVFAFKREGYMKTSFNVKDFWESVSWPGFRTVAKKYWRTGVGEFYRSFNKSAFTTALQKLIPDIRESDLMEGGSGVRAQACTRAGELLDDFFIHEQHSIIHVCNAPSPAATSSLSIGDYISQRALQYIN